MRGLSFRSVLARLRQVWGQRLSEDEGCPPGCALHRTSTASLREEPPAPLHKAA